MEKSEPNSSSRVMAGKFWRAWIENFQQHEANDTIPEEWKELKYEKHLSLGFCDQSSIQEDCKVGSKRTKKDADGPNSGVTKSEKSPTSATVDNFLTNKVIFSLFKLLTFLTLTSCSCRCKPRRKPSKQRKTR